MLEHLIPAKPTTATEWLMMPHVEEPADGFQHTWLLDGAVSLLTPTERQCVEAIFYERITYEALSKRLGFSKPYTWRITRRALNVLKQTLLQDPFMNERYAMYTDWNSAASAVVERYDDAQPLPANMEVVNYTATCLAAAVRNHEALQPMLFNRMAQEAVGHLKQINEWDPETFLLLLCSKQNDYGHGNINAFGLIGVSVRICDKVARLNNISKNRRQVKNETIVDTWVDIVGYCVIAAMLLNDSFKLQLEMSA